MSGWMDEYLDACNGGRMDDWMDGCLSFVTLLSNDSVLFCLAIGMHVI